MGVFPVERLDKSKLVLVKLIQPIEILLTNKTYPRHGIINDMLVWEAGRDINMIHIYDLHRMKNDISQQNTRKNANYIHNAAKKKMEVSLHGNVCIPLTWEGMNESGTLLDFPLLLASSSSLEKLQPPPLLVSTSAHPKRGHAPKTILQGKLDTQG